jgi:tetratricopeptide (TPR) repeat protein
VDRSGEIHALWQASSAAAAGEDSALAVRLADDAVNAGRQERLALQLARTAMHWARLESAPLNEAERLSQAAAHTFASATGRAREHGESLIVRARVKLRAADAALAGKLASEALGLLPDAPGTAAAEAHLVLATVALSLGGDPATHLGRARTLLADRDRQVFGSDRPAARCWRELGDLYGQVGDRSQQTAAYRKALEAAGVRSMMAGLTVDATLSH